MSGVGFNSETRWEHSELQKEIETPVLLAHAIEDSTDIFRISGGGFEPPKPPRSVCHWLGCISRNGATGGAYGTEACSTSSASGTRLNCFVLWPFVQAAAVEQDWLHWFCSPFRVADCRNCRCVVPLVLKPVLLVVCVEWENSMVLCLLYRLGVDRVWVWVL